MTLYEANFIKLNSLLGKQRPAVGQHVSEVPGDCGLFLDVHEQTKYTCMFNLTYLFHDADGVVADPDLSGRIYYDAKMVEVVSWADEHRHAGLRKLCHSVRNEHGTLESRWSRNLMLSKWLEYLNDSGHAF